MPKINQEEKLVKQLSTEKANTSGKEAFTNYIPGKKKIPLNPKAKCVVWCIQSVIHKLICKEQESFIYIVVLAHVINVVNSPDHRQKKIWELMIKRSNFIHMS